MSHTPHAELDESIKVAALRRLAYDGNLEQLSYIGVMSEAVAIALKEVTGTTEKFKNAIDGLYFGIKRRQIPSLPNTQHCLPAEQRCIPAGRQFTSETEIRSSGDPARVEAPAQEQQALQAVSEAAQTSLDFARALLGTPPFPIHAAGQAGQSALNDLLELESPGLSVKFFPNDNVRIRLAAPGIASDLDYAPLVNGVGNPLPANPTSAAISGIWNGYLEAPDSGFFRPAHQS